MPADEDLAGRILELECRLTYQDETIDRLNDVVRAQWAGIDQLKNMLQQLERRVAEAEEQQDSAPTGKPPHY